MAAKKAPPFGGKQAKPFGQKDEKDDKKAPAKKSAAKKAK